MPQFYNPHSRVTFFAYPMQLPGHAIIPAQQETGLPALRIIPLRRSLHLGNEPLNHTCISTKTGERLSYCELEDVSKESDMMRVVAENVIPQRPLADTDYHRFIQDIQNGPRKLFQRRVDAIRNALEKKTNLDKDSMAVVGNYLF